MIRGGSGEEKERERAESQKKKETLHDTQRKSDIYLNKECF